MILLSQYVERKVFSLDHVPFAMKLYQGGHTSATEAVSVAEMRGLMNEFFAHALHDDWKALLEARISVRFPEGPRSAVIDARNTQFEALNDAITEFKSGYEPELTHLFDRLVPDDGVLLDIGANWGYFPIHLASRPGFHGHIHAFEPMPRPYGDLTRLVTQLGLAKVIDCHRLALSDHAGEASMGTGASVLSGLASLERGGDEVVTMRTVDSLGLDRVDFMKIDVEGHEENVLRGAAAVIDRDQPFIIAESWFVPGQEEKALAPLRFLNEHGYQLYLLGWCGPDGNVFLRHGALTSSLFAMVPFHHPARVQWPGMTNIFACPTARMEQLHGICVNIPAPPA